MTTVYLIQDAMWAAIAALGFAAISHPPRTVYACCPLTAAIGHACRYLLMNNPIYTIHIIPASGLAAFLIGTLAVFIAPRIKCPAEACFSPALLPMIPGMYAYRSFKALLLCLSQQEDMAWTLPLFVGQQRTKCGIHCLGIGCRSYFACFLVQKDFIPSYPINTNSLTLHSLVNSSLWNSDN